jgi:DNA-binding response OmpR family regulator
MDKPLATILVVDDDAKNVKLVEALLLPRGYAVVTASDGAEALQQVSRELPDLILLDVMMPIVDGFEVCKLLKDHPDTCLIPVVIMTALGRREDRIKGIEAGADDFLTKPVHRDELLARIHTSLRLKRAIDAELTSRRQEPPPRPPDRVAGAGASGGSSLAAADSVFRHEGAYWTLAYQGTVCRLKDAKGLHYLAVLLSRPGEECHALALVTAVDPPAASPAPDGARRDGHLAAPHVRVGEFGDAGPVLDAQAKAAYQRRLAELRDELAEAERFHDPVRTATARAELDFLAAELAAAVGLGGRDRRAASHAERARLAVTKAIKAALHTIRASHPALGHHLATSITTGTFCAYTPDPIQPIPWTL